MYFDDVRWHPVDAPLVSYVYDPGTGQVTYVLDGDNLYTRYSYDATGKLVRTYQETLGASNSEKLVSEHSYRFARPIR